MVLLVGPTQPSVQDQDASASGELKAEIVQEERTISSSNYMLSTSPMIEPVQDEMEHSTRNDDNKSMSWNGSGGTFRTQHLPYLLTRKTYLLLWLIVLLGLSVSVVFAVLGFRFVHDEETLRLEKETNAVTASIQTAWSDYNFAALWAHHACSAPNDEGALKTLSCSRNDFSALYEYIKSSEGLSFKSISYVPNVTHAERPNFEAEAVAYYQDKPSMNYTGFSGLIEETTNPRFAHRSEQPFYFPQHFLEPLQGNEPLVDFDLYSSSFSYQIDDAVAAREPLVSTPIPTYEQGALEHYLFLLHPGIQTSVYGKEQRIGLTSMAIRFQDLMQRTSALYRSSRTGETLRVYVYDTMGPTIYFFGGIELSVGGTGAAELGRRLDEVALDSLIHSEENRGHKYVMKQNLEVSQRMWTVVVVSKEHEDSHHFAVAGAVLIFVTSCALAGWMYFRLMRTSREANLRASEDSKRAAEQAALVLSRTENQLSHSEKQVQAQRELNEFLAHEVRNPLAAAISACSFLVASNQEALSALSSSDGEQQDEENVAISRSTSEISQRVSDQQDLGVIKNSLHFIDDLLRSVLDMQKAANKQLKLVETHTDVLKDLFEPVRSILSHRSDSFEFQVSCPQNLVILGDRMRLKQIVLNLASNSRKFTEQGFIRLSASVVDGVVQIAVEDSGPGIPKSKRAKLFDERFQESLDSLQQGTGMGLSLCKLLVHLMGGKIMLDDSFNSGIADCPGARFVVLLNTAPIHFDDLERGESTTDSGSLTSPPQASSESKSFLKQLPENLSVLVTDDDLVIRKMFRRSLKRVAPSWSVEEAANGETALVLTESSQYDLIFVDQYMASVEKQLLGTETVMAMRARGVRSCVCGLSANEMEDDFIKAGATGFMRKPFPTGTEELTGALLQLLFDYGVP